MRILFTICAVLLFAAPVFAQSSQTLSSDLRMAKWNTAVCKSNYNYYHVHGNPPLNPPGVQYFWPHNMSEDALDTRCVEWAVEIYKRRVQTEEALIEGMSKHCCPNVEQAPNKAPHYPGERKEYKNVTDEQRMVEKFAEGLGVR